MRNLNETSRESQVSASQFRCEFNRVVDEAWATIRESASSRHLGDPRLWPELTTIYRRVADLYDRRRVVQADPNVTIHAERQVYSRDRLLVGTIDAYFVAPGGIDLIDYKSGEIADESEPKEEYADQLYFYAQLIRENHGVYPRSLKLVGRDGAFIDVPPSPERSEALASDMRTVLDSYNSLASRSVAAGELATPSSENCLFCDTKPVCDAFWNGLSEMDFPAWNHVARGTQATQIVRSRLGGGNIELTVDRSSLNTKRLKVTRLFEGRYPHLDLEMGVGQVLVLTNLRQPVESNSALVEATERTLIFKAESTK